MKINRDLAIDRFEGLTGIYLEQYPDDYQLVQLLRIACRANYDGHEGFERFDEAMKEIVIND